MAKLGFDDILETAVRDNTDRDVGNELKGKPIELDDQHRR